MTARDVLGGVASNVVMLGKIGLCLVFAIQDRLSERLQARGTPIGERPRVPALRH